MFQEMDKKKPLSSPDFQTVPCCQAYEGSVREGPDRQRRGTPHPAEALKWRPRTSDDGSENPKPNNNQLFISTQQTQTHTSSMTSISCHTLSLFSLPNLTDFNLSMVAILLSVY